MNYEGPERRQQLSISPEDLERIAERAAEKALEKVYAAVGKSVLTKLLYFVGAITVGLFAWLKHKGLI